jgi:hypothetical protein
MHRELDWPPLPLDAWEDTRDTLHLWTQIVGKLRLAGATPVNHWWHVTLALTERGLTTTPIPHEGGTFQIDLDFHDHLLRIALDDGQEAVLPLRPQPVAEFYRAVMQALADLGVHAHIWPVPVEIANPIPFDQDHVHASYDREAVERFWRVLSGAGRLLERYRSGFVGKCSPVHFFWGGFDLAVSRFSGRRAPTHPPVPATPERVVREAYSHEVASVGFWPGHDRFRRAAFYAYAYPAPLGYANALVEPPGAYYEESLGEFVLPYDEVRAAPDLESLVTRFMDSTYEAAATLAGWDRTALEMAAPL